MTKIVKISRTITIIAGCKLEIVILIPKDKELINKYIKKDGNDNLLYLNYNFSGIIGFTIPSKEITNRYLALTEFRKSQFIILIEKMLKIISREEIYYKDANGRLCIIENANNNIKNQIGDTIVALKPIVVYDSKNDLDYKGTRLFLNNTTCYTDLTNMELFSLYNILNKIDIFLYSQSLFNSIINDFRKRSDNENKELNEVENKLDTLLDFDINTEER